MKKSFIIFVIIFAFLLCINVLFPPQSDDIDAIVNHKFGFSWVVKSYLTWNARFGELLFLCFVANLPIWLFDTLNALVGTLFVYLIFFLLFVRIPKDNDNIIIILIALLLLCFAPIGASFLWGAGALNYLWGISIIMLGILPYRIFWQIYFCGSLPQICQRFCNNSYATFALFPLLSFVSGMCSEQFGAVLICVHIIGVIYAKIAKIKLPLWYYLGIVFFILGFLVLYLSPGHSMRSHLDNNFLTLSQFFMLDFGDKMKRILYTLQDSQTLIFVYFSFLLTFVALWKNRKFKYLYLSLLCILIAFYDDSLVHYVSTFFILLTLLKERVYRAIMFLYVVYFLACLAPFQLISIPFRARLGDIVVVVAMICLIYQHYRRILPYYFNIVIVCATLGYASFVFVEYARFYANWCEMVAYIQQQKELGNYNVVVKNIFKSHYDNFYGWFRPTDIAIEVPNPHYAKYFGLETFRLDNFFDN